MPDRWEYQFGKTFVVWIYAPVPRSIWPDKPAITLGQEVKVELYGGPVEQGGEIPPSITGEFYINFGLFALLMAPAYAFLGGAITKSVYWTLVRYNPTPFSIFVYALLFITILPNFFWTQFSQSVVGLIKLSAVLVLLRQVMLRQGMRRPGAPGLARRE